MFYSCEARTQSPPIYEDDEVVVEPALSDEEAYREIKRLYNRGVTDLYKIREILGYRVGIDRIQRLLARIRAERELHGRLHA